MNIQKIPIKFARKITGLFREIKYRSTIKSLKDGDYFLNYQIPSFTQWISKDLVEDIISGKITARKDPLWEKSGAKDLDQYEMYSWQICGMTCLKMILGAIYPDKDYKLVMLAGEAAAAGVYKKNNKSDPRHNLDGMFHKPFIKFIKTYKLAGKSISGAGNNYLGHLILNDIFVIASVHPSIRFINPDDNNRSGHLILIKGFKINNGKIAGFYINNPSGFSSNNSQENHFVDIVNWDRCFSDKAIAIKK